MTTSGRSSMSNLISFGVFSLSPDHRLLTVDVRCIRELCGWNTVRPAQGVGHPLRWPLPSVPNAFDGAGDGTRTRDILLGRQTLYQLSYSREQDRSLADRHHSRGERTRTSDLSVPNAARYRLRHTPDENRASTWLFAPLSIVTCVKQRQTPPTIPHR